MILRDLGDAYTQALVLTDLSALASFAGDSAKAEVLAGEALGLRRTLGDRTGVAVSIQQIAGLAFRRRDYATALALYEECLVIRRDLDHLESLASTLCRMGDVRSTQGDTKAARRLYEQALEVVQQIRDPGPFLRSKPLWELGLLSLFDGDLLDARLRFEAVGRHRAGASAEPRRRQWSIALLALLARAEGDDPGAAELCRQMLDTAPPFAPSDAHHIVCVVVAELLAETGRTMLAARLLGAADGFREEDGLEALPSRQQHKAALAAAHAALGEAEFEAQRASGASLCVEDAAALAREALEPLDA